MARIVVTVPAIHCRGCVDTIEAYLSAEAGILNVAGDSGGKTVQVVYAPDLVTPERIAAALRRIGYPVAAAGASE